MYLFLDYLEVLFIALLISVFTDIDNKKKFCFISSIISFIIMEFFQFYDLFANELAYAIAIINFIIVSIMKKKINLYNFIPCILSPWVSVFTSTIGIYLFKLITSKTIQEIVISYRIAVIIVARIIFLIIINLIGYFKNKIKDSIIEQNKELLTVVMLLIFGIYYIILNDIGHLKVKIENMYIILFLLTILFFVVCMLFVKMTRIYNERTKYMIKNKELEYIERNKSIVHYLHDSTLTIQHSLKYGLILIEDNINKGKYGEAKKQIDNFYDMLDNKTNIITNNYILDTLLNDYIFSIRSQFNTKVKSLINVSNNDIFKNPNMCTKLLDIISSYFEQSDKKYLEIKLIEHDIYIEMILLINFENRNNMIDVEKIKKIERNIKIEQVEKYLCLKAIIDKENNDVLEVFKK